jgi:hypothetical protein
VSGLETLPPDQRAVLQLILVQGRGYADLAGVLKIDLDAVRSRALAGLEALAVAAAGGELAAAERARIADYLLGQQDDGERIVTLARLGESPAACRWAQALHAQLAPLAREPLPEVPVPASANGVGAALRAAAEPPAAATIPAAIAAPRRPDPATLPDAAPGISPRLPSRLGGAILIGAVAVSAVVLAIVLLSGGDDGKSSSARASATTAAASTQASTPAQTQTGTTAQPSARPIAQVNLTAAAGAGQAIGLGLVERNGRQLVLAVEATKLPANGAHDIDAMWLQGPAGAKFLGFVPNRVAANGTFTVSATLPSNVRSYTQVLVTRESIAAVPRLPGPTILSGSLKLP